MYSLDDLPTYGVGRIHYDYLACQEIQDDIVQGYEDDFPKYRKKVSAELLRATLRSVASQVTKKSVYAQVGEGCCLQFFMSLTAEKERIVINFFGSYRLISYLCKVKQSLARAWMSRHSLDQSSL